MTTEPNEEEMREFVRALFTDEEAEAHTFPRPRDDQAEETE